MIALSVDGVYPTAPIAIGTARQVYSMPFALVQVFADDVVRARNRLAQSILDTTDADYILWWDTDMFIPDLQGTLDAMILSGHDVIGSEYPRKRKPRTMVGKPLPGAFPAPRERGTITEMSAVGFGFTLTSRRALEFVGASARKYFDVLENGDRVLTADRFGLAYRHLDGQGDLCECAYGPDVYGNEEPCANVELVSEDYSFCLRWREPYDEAGRKRTMSGRVYIHTPNVPNQHIGPHAYD